MSCPAKAGHRWPAPRQPSMATPTLPSPCRSVRPSVAICRLSACNSVSHQSAYAGRSRCHLSRVLSARSVVESRLPVLSSSWFGRPLVVCAVTSSSTRICVCSRRRSVALLVVGWACSVRTLVAPVWPPDRLSLLDISLSPGHASAVASALSTLLCSSPFQLRARFANGRPSGCTSTHFFRLDFCFTVTVWNAFDVLAQVWPPAPSSLLSLFGLAACGLGVAVVYPFVCPSSLTPGVGPTASLAQRFTSPATHRSARHAVAAACPGRDAARLSVQVQVVYEAMRSYIGVCPLVKPRLCPAAGPDLLRPPAYLSASGKSTGSSSASADILRFAVMSVIHLVTCCCCYRHHHLRRHHPSPMFVKPATPFSIFCGSTVCASPVCHESRVKHAHRSAISMPRSLGCGPVDNLRLADVQVRISESKIRGAV